MALARTVLARSAGSEDGSSVEPSFLPDVLAWLCCSAPDDELSVCRCASSSRFPNGGVGNEKTMGGTGAEARSRVDARSAVEAGC